MTFTDNRPKRKWYKKLLNWFDINSDLFPSCILVSFSNILCAILCCKIFTLFSIDIVENKIAFIIVWILLGCLPTWYLIAKIRDND